MVNQKSLDKKKGKELPKKAVGHYTIQNQPNVMNIISLKIPKELEWEKEFDEKYQEVIGDLIDSAIDVGSKTDNNPLVIDLNPIRLLTPEFIEARTKLENFIQSLLTQQRTELLEEILEQNKDDMTGLYDYDGIAETVISFLNKKDE